MNFAALASIQLDFLFHSCEDHNLFILVEDAITALIKDIEEFLWGAYPQQVINVLSPRLKDKSYIGVVQKTLFPEVSFLNGAPDLFAFARSADERS